MHQQQSSGHGRHCRAADTACLAAQFEPALAPAAAGMTASVAVTETPASSLASSVELDPSLVGLSYARLSARTQGFRLGAPRAIQVAADGSRIAFVRSSSAASTVNQLLVVDVGHDGSLAHERVVVDPAALLGADENVPAEERARRERMRETTSGVTTFTADAGLQTAVFALSGELWLVSLEQSGAAPTRLDVPGPVIDPRLSPQGTHVAFIARGGIHVLDLVSGNVRTLATAESDAITYGLANFVAAEELDRHRGHWWSPDGRSLLVERADSTEVSTWWIADPANPSAAPHEHRYPAAGTTNPALELHIYDINSGGKVVADWDRAAFEYLVTVGWQKDHKPLITVMNRRQDRQQVLEVDPVSGATSLLWQSHDECWVEWISGLPAWSPAGELVVHHDDLNADTRRVSVVRSGALSALSPQGLQVQSVLAMDESGLLIAATPDSPFMQVHHIGWDGNATVVADSDDDGWHSATAGSASPEGLMVVASTGLAATATTFRVLRDGRQLGELRSRAVGPESAVPPVNPRVALHHVGTRELRTMVLFPEDHVMGSRRLPVVMCPYGGPHAVVAVAAGLSHARAQFLANQGFAVVIADGRGTPRRGPRWERAVFRDLAQGVLQDQVDAVQAVGALYPDDIDLGRVGIRGWSFGGYLSALAVLQRPDVFHAAVAGAPVTEWRLYDTGYTERYLGHPATDAAAYDACSLLPLAPQLQRALLLIHGLADDNVVAAHSLQLSGALLAAGRHHEFLALSGVTHMAPQEVISENLLKMEVAFFEKSL